MKLRFWQKTYLFTLILFLVCLNAGILSLTLYTHRKNVDAAETAAKAEQYYLSMCFERDAEEMEKAGNDSLSLLMLTYGAHYEKSGVYLSFSQNGRILYSTLPFPVSVSSGTLTHLRHEGVRHLVIVSPILDGTYELTWVKSAAQIDTEFRALFLIYLLTAVGVSVFLAFVLYLILKRLSQPLDALKRTTERIEGGDYSVRAEEKGNDEFTLLARSFNSMLSTLNTQMQTLEADAEKKQQLVDNLAHELRTPLTCIHGYAELLEKAALPEEKKHVAQHYILSETERLQRIASVLLDSAFLRGNPPEMRAISLPPLLSSVAQSLTPRAAEKGVTVSTDLSDCTVSGNETLLSMLFYNLAENAVKACGNGGHVTLFCTEAEAGVEDDGKGMTEEQLLHVTEPFYRTDKARSRAEGGAGLGLALCRQIAEAHGTALQFTSSPGKGTKIILPFTTRKQVGDETEENAE